MALAAKQLLISEAWYIGHRPNSDRLRLKIDRGRSDKLDMNELKSLARRVQASGMLAIDACGDGFWEFDLLAGSAWFSDWFYRKIPWPRDERRTVIDLKPLLQASAWDDLMRKFRAHLEQRAPLDLNLHVEMADERIECWHLKGSALRDGAGQPRYLAGSVSDTILTIGNFETCSSFHPLNDA